MGVILYIAIGACVAIIVLKIMGNVALRTAYKLANTQGGTFNDSNAGIGYCRNCGNTVSRTTASADVAAKNLNRKKKK